MKYMIEWQIRTEGLNHQQCMDNLEALETASSQWKPEPGLQVDAFVATIGGGMSGYEMPALCYVDQRGWRGRSYDVRG
jgi:hypothetical protein